MKQFSKRFLVASFFLMSVSSEVYSMGSRRPLIPPIPPTQTTKPPTVVTPVLSGPYVEQVKNLVSGSACASYNFKNRGRAPAGYIKGVAVSFARSLCRLKNTDSALFSLAEIMSAADSNNDSKDALTHYKNNFQSLIIDTHTAGEEALRAVYTLGIGLGMRESSGKYCEGWDTSAGSSRSSSAGEAGIFQTSYDSLTASPLLGKLYSEYQTLASSRCFLSVFQEGVSCKTNSTLGTGAGADFQKFNKACPAFATEEAIAMLRIRRNHYGPINRNEAEIVPACNQLLKNIQDLVERDLQGVCQEIL